MTDRPCLLFSLASWICSVASVSILLAIRSDCVFWDNTPRKVTSLTSYSEVKNQVSLYVSFEITYLAWQKTSVFFSHLILKWIFLHRSDMSECRFLCDYSNWSCDHLQSLVNKKGQQWYRILEHYYLIHHLTNEVTISFLLAFLVCDS